MAKAKPKAKWDNVKKNWEKYINNVIIRQEIL